jgi:hypothetical protein
LLALLDGLAPVCRLTAYFQSERADSKAHRPRRTIS